MKKLSPNKTFQFLAQMLQDVDASGITLNNARYSVEMALKNSPGYEFAPVYIPDGTTGETSLVFAVGEFDQEKGCYPMHLDFIEGHLIPMYGLDWCFVARTGNPIFASFEYTRNLLNAPDLTPNQFKLIVEAPSEFAQFMTDSCLKESYQRMLDGDTLYGRQEEEDAWNLNVKFIGSDKLNTFLFESHDALIDGIQKILRCDSQKIRQFVGSEVRGEINTPELILMFNRVGSWAKMYIDPEREKK